MKPGKPATDATALRRCAEQRLKNVPSRTDVPLSAHQTQRLLKELELRQAELEIQNEELQQARMELETSRARYWDLYDTAPVGYVAVSEKGIILEANLAAATLLGVLREALIQHRLSRFLFKEDLTLYDLYCRKLCMTAEPQGCELRMVHQDGTVFWVQLAATAVQQAEGGFEYRITLNSSAERRQAEEILRTSEERLRAITEFVKDAIVMMDQNGTVSYWNPAAGRLLGYAANEALGKNLHQLIVPQRYHRKHEKGFAAFQRSGQGDAVDATHEVQACHKDGHEIPVELSISAFSFQNAWHSIAIIRDISDRKRNEEALRKSEERLRYLHDASHSGIGIHDQGVIVDCNQGLSDMSGYSREELVGMEVFKLIAPAWHERVRQSIHSNFDQFYEVEGVCKDGTTIPVDIRGKNIPYEERMCRAFEIQDVTERHQAQKKQEQLQAQLNQAQRMESVGRLAGGVAHDFNNMLSVILGYAELALGKITPSHSLHDDLLEIYEAGKISAEVTQQLLAFARKQTIAPKVLDLNDTVEGMLKMLRRLIGEDINLAWLPGNDSYLIRMDPSQVDQLLANLCVNARDAIAGVGKLTIETEQVTFDEAYCADHAWFVPGDYALLAVSDDGSGMDKETVGKIFEPFFTTKEEGYGTGLGLAMVYGIVKQNNGFINVYSELGYGTTFKIYFPLHQSEPKGVLQDSITESIPSGHGETVLVVEDEAAVLRISSVMLKTLGYNVLTAFTPAEALSTAESQGVKIDLLLTDVVMPEMNGRELAARLQAACPDIKILYMSGYTADTISHRGVLDEGVSFIQKPFSQKELAIKIGKILE